MPRLRRSAVPGGLPTQAAWRRAGHRGEGPRPSLQPLLRARRVPPPDHAPVGSIPGPTRVRRSRGGRGERGRADGDGSTRHRAGDGRVRAYDAAMDGLVARSVHRDQPVRGSLGAPGPRTHALATARVAARAILRRPRRARREATRVPGASHDGELPDGSRWVRGAM